MNGPARTRRIPLGHGIVAMSVVRTIVRYMDKMHRNERTGNVP